MSSNAFTFVLIGGGPRGAMCMNAFVATLMAHDKDVATLKKSGANYDIKVTMIEHQDESQLARGNAYGSDHTGVINTGAQWRLVPLQAAGADGDKMAAILELGDIESKLKVFAQDFTRTQVHIKKANSVGAIMFKAAVSAASTTPAEELGLDTACLMRADIGEMLLSVFNGFREAAKKRLPYLTLDVQTGTQATGVNFAQDTGTRVTTRKIATSDEATIEADMVHLHTGTTLTPPAISDPKVKSMTYCGAMTPDKLHELLHRRNLLNVGGKLRRGTKVLIGGTNLSAIDTMVALETYMSLVQEDKTAPGGYRINARAAQDHAGAITFVSFEPCMFANPRVSFGEGWRQRHKAVGTTKHMHALFLHEYGQDLCNVWSVIQRAAIARTNGLVPTQAFPKFANTKEQLAAMYKSTLTYFECMEKAGRAEQSGGMDCDNKKDFLDQATHSLYGARMQAAMNRTNGYGMERDLEEVRTTMTEAAPLTWGGRHGWFMERAQLAVITDPAFAGDKSNAVLYKDWFGQDWDLSGSPPAMHGLAAKLAEAGVVEFVTASYEEITADDQGIQLQLKNKVYDAFLVAPQIRRDVEDTSNALKGQVTPVHAHLPTHPIVGKHRAMISKQGDTMNVEDYGLSGRGAKIRHADGTVSHLNAYAEDVNSLASAVDTMPSVAMRMTMATHLAAASVGDPWGVLRTLYDGCRPSIEDYTEEVMTFAPLFREAHELAIFYEMLERAANGDAKAFALGYDASSSVSGRKATLDVMAESKHADIRAAKAEHDRRCVNIEPFLPPTRDAYYARFVDTTVEEDLKVYARVLEIAKEHLGRNAGTVLAKS